MVKQGVQLKSYKHALDGYNKMASHMHK